MPDALAARLEGALGVTLPPDFGTIQLMPADRLVAAQTVVKIFDIVVIALIALAVALALLAIWLAQRRRRMVVYLALGTLIAFILMRFSARTLPSAVTAGIQDQGIAGALRSVIAAVAADLVGLTTIILVVTVAILIVAYVAGRPAWLVRLTSRSAGAVSAGASRTAAAAADARSRSSTDLAPTIRQNRSAVERVGIGAIAFFVAWIAIGLEVALLGLALVAAWLLIVRIVTSEPDTTDDASAAAPSPATTPGPAGPASEAGGVSPG